MDIIIASLIKFFCLIIFAIVGVIHNRLLVAMRAAAAAIGVLLLAFLLHTSAATGSPHPLCNSIGDLSSPRWFAHQTAAVMTAAQCAAVPDALLPSTTPSCVNEHEAPLINEHIYDDEFNGGCQWQLTEARCSERYEYRTDSSAAWTAQKPSTCYLPEIDERKRPASTVSTGKVSLSTKIVVGTDHIAVTNLWHHNGRYARLFAVNALTISEIEVFLPLSALEAIESQASRRCL